MNNDYVTCNHKETCNIIVISILAFNDFTILILLEKIYKANRDVNVLR